MLTVVCIQQGVWPMTLTCGRCLAGVAGYEWGACYW
jgi:hypothetical protein